MLKDHHLSNIEENSSKDPTNYEQAMVHNDSKQWQDAMMDELESIKKNDVWELTALPDGRKVIRCKWVLRKKFKADSSLEKYKARLVAKGFTQQSSVDFVDTYSPVAKFASNRIIMSVVATMDLEFHQLDVETTFLNGELKEDIFMLQPKGFEIKGLEDEVYKLKSSPYGLKQSFRQWYLKFHRAILEIGFEMNPLDHCVYIWRCYDELKILSLYVDDILLAGNSLDMMIKTKSFLASRFEMKDMGLATCVRI